MFAAVYHAVSAATDWFWGVPALIILIGGGIWLTICTRFVQFRHFKTAMKMTIGKMFTKNKTKGEGGITGWQTVCAALSGTIGTGNIVGVGTAIAMGGPGAVFWMELTGCIAMCIKYCEAMMAVKYRRKKEDGTYAGGPYYYIRDGLKCKPLAIFWNVVLIPTLLVAAAIHTGSTCDAASRLGLPRVPVMVVTVLIVAAIMYGGVRALCDVTDKLVPIMSLLYLGSGLIVIAVNAENILPSIISVFEYAFTGHAAVGGFAGAGVAATIRYGLARGMYSSDAGNGIAAIIHSQANTKEPVEQGFWGIFEVFMDTIIVCNFTALVILTTGRWEMGDQGSVLAINSFESVLGNAGLWIAAVSLMLFAMSTVMSFSTFVGLQAENVWGKMARNVCQVIFLAMMIAGGLEGVDSILFLTDTFSGLCICGSLVALILMGSEIRKETDRYFHEVYPALTAKKSENEKEMQ